MLESSSDSAESFVAAIGPAIGPCCYEVDAERIQLFQNKFSDDPSIITPQGRSLDLQQINAFELKRLGLNKLEILKHCTQCSKTPEFHSFRKDGTTKRQVSIIEIVS